MFPLLALIFSSLEMIASLPAICCYILVRGCILDVVRGTLAGLLYWSTLYQMLWTCNRSIVVGLPVLPHMVWLAELQIFLVLDLSLRIEFPISPLSLL